MIHVCVSLLAPSIRILGTYYGQRVEEAISPFSVSVSPSDSLEGEMSNVEDCANALIQLPSISPEGGQTPVSYEPPPPRN